MYYIFLIKHLFYISVKNRKKELWTIRNYNKNLAFTLSYFCDLIQNVGIMEGSTCIKNKNTVPIQQKFLMWYLYAQC